VEIHTIGFTQKTAEEFFELLRAAGIKRLVDVRLNNVSQLAGFAKRDDLRYFLRELCDADYVHLPILAPDEGLLKGYRDKTISWEDYVPRYQALLTERRVEEVLDRSLFGVPAVLLCSEPTAERCHRRLAAEYLAGAWGGAVVRHL